MSFRRHLLVCLDDAWLIRLVALLCCFVLTSKQSALAQTKTAQAISLSANAAQASDPQAPNAQTSDPQLPATTAPSNAQAAPPTNSVLPPKLLLFPSQEGPWIDPDRPHIADSSVNVPKGYYLQENGMVQWYQRHTSYFDIPEMLMRFGVFERTELRLNVPNYVVGHLYDQHVSGVEDIQVGFKTRLCPLPGKIELAVNPYITVPTGNGGTSNDRVTPNFKFPYSRELNEKWEIEGMHSFFFPRVNNQTDMDWQATIVLDRNWHKRVDAFIEYASDVIQHQPISQIIHFGIDYRYAHNRMVDTHFGFGLTGGSPHAFFGFGYSLLLGKFY